MPPMTTSSTAAAAAAGRDARTVRVTYGFTVAGQHREFTAKATVSGDPAEAAMNLTHSTLHDAEHWLKAQPFPLQDTTVMVRGLFFRHPTKVKAPAFEPSKEPQGGTVTATVQIGTTGYGYSSEFSTLGNPYGACVAVLNAAKEDLWTWAYDRRAR